MKLFTSNSTVLTLALAVLGTTAAYASPVTVAPITAGSPLASGQLGYNTNVSGWTNQVIGSSPTVYGYNFVYANQAAALAGAAGSLGTVAMDPATLGDGSTSTPFFALDGDFEVGAVSTTLSNLTIGDVVTVTFDWAATQQLASECGQCSGASTDQLQVSLGSQNDLTSVLSIGSQGFSGWHDGVSLTFTATAASETLSFLDMGTPTGSGQDPAFALLDNVSASQAPTPEPSSLLLLGTGLAGLGGLLRSRFSKNASTIA